MRLFAIFLLSVMISSCGNNKKDKETSEFEVQGGEIVIDAELPDAPRWLSDYEQIFTPLETDSINSICNEIFEKCGHIPMIHTISDFSPYNNLNEYTNAIDIAWSDPGQKYFIIIISEAMEEVRFIHGQETEEQLHPDFADSVMQNDMFPNFRTGNYGTGIIESLKSYLKALHP
jgi:uncharacterized membrane protein YgcG